MAFGMIAVLVVLLAQFRRARLALAVWVTVPLAVVGALATLWAAQIPLNASSLMGCVLLVGLVVKNGILLLEHYEVLMEQSGSYRQGSGPHREARPRARASDPDDHVGETAFSGPHAALALGIGAGAEAAAAMLALAVIGGLSLVERGQLAGTASAGQLVRRAALITASLRAPTRARCCVRSRAASPPTRRRAPAASCRGSRR